MLRPQALGQADELDHQCGHERHSQCHARENVTDESARDRRRSQVFGPEISCDIGVQRGEDQGRAAAGCLLPRGCGEVLVVAVVRDCIRAEPQREAGTREPQRELEVLETVAVERLVVAADGEELAAVNGECAGVRLLPAER